MVNDYEVPIDKGNNNIYPIIKGERVYVPLRFVAESMGLNVDYSRTKSKGNIIHKITLDKFKSNTKPKEYSVKISTDIGNSEEFEKELVKDFEKQRLELIDYDFEESIYAKNSKRDVYTVTYKSNSPVLGSIYNISKDAKNKKYKFSESVSNDDKLFSIYIKSTLSDNMIKERIKIVNVLLEIMSEG